MICHGISFKQKACLAMEPSEEHSAWRAWPTCPSQSLCLKIQLTNEAERFSAKTGLWCRSLSVPDCQQAWHGPMPPPNLALKGGSDLRRSRCRCWGNEEKLVAWFILWYDIMKWFGSRIIIQQSTIWKLVYILHSNMMVYNTHKRWLYVHVQYTLYIPVLHACFFGETPQCPAISIRPVQPPYLGSPSPSRSHQGSKGRSWGPLLSLSRKDATNMIGKAERGLVSATCPTTHTGTNSSQIGLQAYSMKVHHPAGMIRPWKPICTWLFCSELVRSI